MCERVGRSEGTYSSRVPTGAFSARLPPRVTRRLLSFSYLLASRSPPQPPPEAAVRLSLPSVGRRRKQRRRSGAWRKQRDAELTETRRFVCCYYRGRHNSRLSNYWWDYFTLSYRAILDSWQVADTYTVNPWGEFCCVWMSTMIL